MSSLTESQRQIWAVPSLEHVPAAEIQGYLALVYERLDASAHAKLPPSTRYVIRYQPPQAFDREGLMGWFYEPDFREVENWHLFKALDLASAPIDTEQGCWLMAVCRTIASPDEEKEITHG
jgi:hypothetical protein